MRFEKWEGLGNDFVVVRGPTELDDALVRRLCDRRLGIGADGVLLVEDTGKGPPRMIVRNADGSRPEMCGNGLRCVAGALGREGAIEVVTDAGRKTCAVRRLGDAAVEVVVDMGPVRHGPDLLVDLGGRAARFMTVDMGNPHAVTFDVYGEEQLAKLGPELGARVAGGTNVELCRELPGEIEVLVWERGVGRTLACGTGACAVAAAACASGRARFGQPLRVRLPGGPLEITVAEGTRDVRMKGPARRVFTGEVVLA